MSVEYRPLDIWFEGRSSSPGVRVTNVMASLRTGVLQQRELAGMFIHALYVAYLRCIIE